MELSRSRIIRYSPSHCCERIVTQETWYTISIESSSRHENDGHIRLTSLPFISGRSTSHSSRRTAKRESPTMTDNPRLHTRVMA